MTDVPKLCTAIKVENIEPDDTTFGQENAGPREYPVAYSPIPNGTVKEEPTSEEDGDDCQLVAYSPLPQGVIKEESEDDGRDEVRSGVLPNKRKRTSTDQRSSGTIPSSSQIPRNSPTKGGNTLKNVDVGEKQWVNTEDLAFVESDAGAKKQQSTEHYDERSEHSSLDGVFSSDEEDPTVPNQPLAGPAQRKKKSIRKLSVELGHSHEKEKLAFKCNNCGRAFKSEPYLKRHLARSCGIEPKFKCDQCAGHQFKRKYEFQRHLMRTHQVEKSQLSKFGAGPEIRSMLPFKCDKCGKAYKTKGTLSKHLKYECQVDPSFPCVLCDYRAKQKDTLRDHLMGIHNVDPSQFTAHGAAAPVVRPLQPHKCEKCGRTYKNKSTLKRHLTYECGRDPSFSCNQCDFMVSLKCNLKKHLINVHADADLSQLEA